MGFAGQKKGGCRKDKKHADAFGKTSTCFAKKITMFFRKDGNVF